MHLKNPTPYVLILALLSVAAGGELPPDRQPLGAPPEKEGEQADPLILPPSPDDEPGGEAGDVSWSTPSPVEVETDSRLGLISSAFGAAGALGGFAGLFYLNSVTAVTPESRRGWRNAAHVFAGLAGAALVTGIVLWATAPSPQVTAAVTTGGNDLRLTLRF